MQNWRPREDRKPVRIGVRIRTDTGWTDATIQNVSARGLMLHSLRPLARNEFIEVARGRHHIVGRIVWSEGAGCGMRTQDQIDIAGLLGKPSMPPGANDRRQSIRVPARRSAPVRTIQEQAQASRALGQGFERLMVLVVGAAVGLFAAGSAYEALASPLQEVGLALGGAPA